MTRSVSGRGVSLAMSAFAHARLTSMDGPSPLPGVAVLLMVSEPLLERSPRSQEVTAFAQRTGNSGCRE